MSVNQLYIIFPFFSERKKIKKNAFFVTFLLLIKKLLLSLLLRCGVIAARFCLTF